MFIIPYYLIFVNLILRTGFNYPKKSADERIRLKFDQSVILCYHGCNIKKKSMLAFICKAAKYRKLVCNSPEPWGAGVFIYKEGKESSEAERSLFMAKPKIRSQYELAKSIRGSWNKINPVTKVIPDKTKYTRKVKHKGKQYSEPCASFI